MRATAIARSALLLAAGLPAAARADDGPALSIYGFARLDFIVDDSTMSDPQTPYFVLSEPAGAADNGELAMHPRLSRVGLTLDEWELSDGWSGEGTLEVDFQNGGAAGAPTMRLRHAYFNLKWQEKLEVLAGQTWDLMSPLFPSAGNDTLMANAGNTGDRRAQFRVAVTPTDRLRLGVAAAPPGALDVQDADADGRMDGVESGLPMLQWLIEYRMRTGGSDEPARIGVWGHWAQDELADGTERASRSVGGHVFLPVTRELVLFGELYTGRNLDDVRGGIGQGINPTTMRGIDGAGGWVEAAYVTSRHYMIAAGATVDTAQEADLPDGGRVRNLTGYAVQRLRIKDSVQLGLEYLRWMTEYKNAPSGTANRVNLHLSVFF